MKTERIKFNYEVPEMTIVDIIVNNDILQASVSSSDLEDMDPINGGWV